MANLASVAATLLPENLRRTAKHIRKRQKNHSIKHLPPFTNRNVSATARETTVKATAGGEPLVIPDPEQFLRSNPLLAESLKKQTRRKYCRALAAFLHSPFSKSLQLSHLDERFAKYIQSVFTADPRPVRRQGVTDALCMILLMYPFLKDSFGRTRRSIRTWEKNHPSCSSVPITRQLLYAIAWRAFSTGKEQFAIMLLLSFAAYLRVSEVLKLTWNQVAFPGDPRISGFNGNIGGLNIKDAKTGPLQFVPIRDPVVLFAAQIYRDKNQQHSFVASETTQTSYAKTLRSILSAYNPSHLQINPHSARIGAATEDFIKEVPVEKIAITARWESMQSLRRYVTNGRSWLMNMNIPSDVGEQIEADANCLIQRFRNLPFSTSQQSRHCL
ncbi:Phage integrase [Gracilaria domingensis]|nr:Phage integrase [Gracilaria domingensis]